MSTPSCHNSTQFSRHSGLLLWLMFVFICFGLGYPTLNRYDPTHTGGIIDSGHYFQLVISGPRAVDGQYRYRILVPYLAKPVFLAVVNRLGTWNPVSFALLVVNSAFCATSALMF